MIRIIMLDLGGTLVKETTLELLPGAAEALTQISQMTNAAGATVAVCLVSNFEPRPADIQQFFNQYVGILDNLGISQFFQPVDQKVTLSSHTTTWKPDRSVFELAIRRLGVSATLAECLFITEEEQHVTAARSYGMKALRRGTDFQTWQQGTQAIEELLAEA